MLLHVPQNDTREPQQQSYDEKTPQNNQLEVV